MVEWLSRQTQDLFLVLRAQVRTLLEAFFFSHKGLNILMKKITHIP